MQLNTNLALSLPKDLESESLNEDSYSINKNKDCICISDGASESYDSKTWAQLLTKSYVSNWQINKQWIDERANDYNEQFDLSTLSWSQQLAFERGSFASLLGLSLNPDGNIKVLAIGDSLAVHIRNNEIINSFPFSDSLEFDKRPLLISTLHHENKLINDSFLTEHCATWSVLPDDYLLLTTDAIGHWILSDQNALTALSKVKNLEDFKKVVEVNRSNGLLRIDDSTVLRVTVVDVEPNTLS